MVQELDLILQHRQAAKAQQREIRLMERRVTAHKRPAALRNHRLLAGVCLFYLSGLPMELGTILGER